MERSSALRSLKKRENLEGLIIVPEKEELKIIMGDITE